MSHNHGLLRLELRPRQVFVARYEHLPYPSLGPVQEFVCEAGILAAAPVTITSVVFQVYAGSQLVSQRHFSGHRLGAVVGETPPIRVQPGEGLALRHCYFLEPGLERLTQVFVTVEAKTDEGQAVQAQWGAPLLYFDQQTTLRLPFSGTWWAIMGNDWTDLHKGEPISQAFAIDFVKLGPNNNIFASDGLTNEDHFSFGQPVLAPAGGEVIVATGDMADHSPSAQAHPEELGGDARRTFGNALFIAHNEGEFSFLAHLQAGSLAVRSGEWVMPGQMVARCGNSGLSPGPHLHYHLQNGPHLYVDQGLPVRFSLFSVTGDRITQGSIPSRLIVTPFAADDTESNQQGVES